MWVVWGDLSAHRVLRCSCCDRPARRYSIDPLEVQHSDKIRIRAAHSRNALITQHWHDFSPGDYVPRQFNAAIEIPLGSNIKYELDKGSGLIRMDRVLYSSVFYSANQGFIPRTLAEDHDPLDVLSWPELCQYIHMILRIFIVIEDSPNYCKERKR